MLDKLMRYEKRRKRSEVMRKINQVEIQHCTKCPQGKYESNEAHFSSDSCLKCPFQLFFLDLAEELDAISKIGLPSKQLQSKKNIFIGQGKGMKEYVELKNNGIPERSIAKKWGISFEELAQWKNENEFFNEKSSERIFQTKKYAQMRNNLISDEEITEKWGISKTKLANWKSINGIKNNNLQDFL